MSTAARCAFTSIATSIAICNHFHFKWLRATAHCFCINCITFAICNYTGWPQSHAPMLIKKVIVVTFVQIQSSLQGLQMLDMFPVCSYAKANMKFKVPADTIQKISLTINLKTSINNTTLQMI